MNSSQEEAKIAFGDLLSSTVASKSGTFAVGRQANRVIPNFPANPGLRVRGIAGIDPNENISLPLSDEMGEIFFRDKEAPRFTKEGEQDAVGPASDDIDITHPMERGAYLACQACRDRIRRSRSTQSSFNSLGGENAVDSTTKFEEAQLAPVPPRGN